MQLTCDRCGIKIDHKFNSTKIQIKEKNQIDLCNNCTANFFIWLETSSGERKPLIQELWGKWKNAQAKKRHQS